jgi:hypothetical protein
MSLHRQIIDIDPIVGLRAWGLILYGALPANLALLGTLEVKLRSINELFPFLIPASLLPLTVTFLLIRNRQKDWYLTTDYLGVRSVVTTVLIVLCATLISGASGILQGKYKFSLSSIGTHEHIAAIAESFLFGVGSLVITSTLLMTIFTKNTDLPGLPSSKIIELIASIRKKIIQLKTDPIWAWSEQNVGDQVLKNSIAIVDKLKEDLEELFTYPDHHLIKLSMTDIRSLIGELETAIKDVQSGGGVALKKERWEILFADLNTLNNDQKIERNRKEHIYCALQKLKCLQLEG